VNEVAPFIAKSFDGFLAANEHHQCLKSGN
jgi:hypothetical protein